MVMYLLRLLSSLQLLLQITYICCDAHGGRSTQNKKSFASNVDKLDLSVNAKVEDQLNINERDTNGLQGRLLRFKDHHGIPSLQRLSGNVKERPKIENSMSNDYNDENEENNSLKEAIPNSRLAMAIGKDKIHSPRYSVLRRNKPRLKEYQSNLENESRKLYARKAQEPRYNEETLVTGEGSMEHKPAPSSTNTTEQTTTQSTLSASTTNSRNTTAQSTGSSGPGNKVELLQNVLQYNRNERDTKDFKSSMLHFKNRQEIPSKQRLSRVFKERSNVENTMNYDYNYDNDESPSLRRELPNSRLEMKTEDDKRHSPRYSGLRRNKPGLKDYHASLENESRQLYARRAQEPRFDEEPIVTDEGCVEYKASSRYTTEQATTDTTLSAGTAIKHNTKTKTNKGNHKTPPTRDGGLGNEVKQLDNEELNEYDKYLCGLFADTFVDAVLVKVRRSRKMAKELGFSNESEETCDRCIELKPSKIPDIEPMRASLGKCSKGGDYSLNNSTCQNSMSDFLDLLLLFETEHENGVYSKIRDDSSFIFTGEYDSSIKKENGLETIAKYHNNRDSFSKDTFEKQHLRDDNTAESDDRVPNMSYSPGKVKTMSHLHLQDSSGSHDSTDEDVEENEDDEIEAETKTNLLKDDKVKKVNNEAELKNFIQLETSVNDKDFTELHGQQDLQSPLRRTYSTNKNRKDKEFDISQYADGANANLNKPAKVRTSKDIHSSFRGPTHNYGRDVHKYEGRRDDSSAYPSKLGQYAEFYGLGQAEGQSTFGNMDHHPRGAELIKTHSKHNTQRQTAGKTQGRKNNYLSYLPGGYEALGLNEESKLYPPYGKINSWEGEYQLYPNQPKNDAAGLLPPPKYYADDGLRMVKRDVEPYDDDLSGFEIPDVEYELY